VKLIAPIIALVAALAPPAPEDRAPAVTVLEGVEVKLLLSSAEARQLGGKLFDAFEVSERGHLLLGIEGSAGRNLVVADVGLRLLEDDDLGLETFRRLPGGALIAICDRQLARYENGGLVREVDLPAAGMRLAPSGNRDEFYVFGGGDDSARVVYRVLRGRRCEKLLETPEAVTALTEMGGRLYVALGTKVLGVSRRGPVSVVYDPPIAAGTILALVGDPATRTLFMATADGVTALRGGRAITLLAGCGGALRLSGGSLYVLDSRRGLVIRVPGVAAQLERLQK
jgi:hypothetical protein